MTNIWHGRKSPHSNMGESLKKLEKVGANHFCLIKVNWSRFTFLARKERGVEKSFERGCTLSVCHARVLGDTNAASLNLRKMLNGDRLAFDVLLF